MSNRSRTLAALFAGFATITVLAACAQPGGSAEASGTPTTSTSASGPATGSPTPSTATSDGATTGQNTGGAALPITIVRTGGFVGVRQTLIVSTSGTWTYFPESDKGAGASQSGQLTGAQQDKLKVLVHDPRLSAEAKRGPGNVACNDTFMYRAVVGGLAMGTDECESDKSPALMALVNFLISATPL